MGGTNSKVEKSEALKMCKLRKKMIKQAIESRYNIAATHISYIESLKNIGVSLRRFAELEVLLESSLSPSHSHCSYPSPTISHIVDDDVEIVNNSRLSYMKSSGIGNGIVSNTFRYDPSSNTHVFVDNVETRVSKSSRNGNGSVSNANVFVDNGKVDVGVENGVLKSSGNGNVSNGNDGVETRVLRINYMKSSGNVGDSGNNSNVSLTFRYNPSNNTHVFVDNGDGDERLVLPPPPPPPDCESWDYFDTDGDKDTSFSNVNRDKLENVERVGVVEVTGKSSSEKQLMLQSSRIDKSKGGILEKEVNEEREDASEFITHRAKDFVSSIKDIENRFFRASESGKEVARMLEANRIRVGYAEAKGSSSPLDSLAAYPLVCCRGKSVHASNDLHTQSVPKVIVWNRSMSSQSSSSRNPLTTASKDDADDSGSECVEDFFMISGSHSSTLDRLYAWERKLHDEVKASEVIRKVYDRKCDQLRHQFAKGLKVNVIDKTRSAVKDLHSRIRVALHAVDSIAKRIEKMRDEELLPQLTELITGFIRMWKAMLECHHAQYITISLAYHAKTSVSTSGGDARKEILNQLQYEFECFGLSFADWMNSHTSYVEALNGWLQNCVMQPQERTRGNRRPFSPRRVLAPPIFVLCRDWSAGIRALPSEDVNVAIRNFLTDLHHLEKQQKEDENQETGIQEKEENEKAKNEEDNSDSKSANLGSVHKSLTMMLDKLTKFSEASLKLYEDIRQKSEDARVAYSNPRPFRY